MCRLALVFFVAMITAANLSARIPLAKEGDPFEGTWNITLTPTTDDSKIPGAKKFDEVLTFTVDKMSAKTLAAMGFQPADYQEDTRRFGPGTFDCTQTSDKEGSVVWHGLTSNMEMTGTLVWTKKDDAKTVIHYDMAGTKKQG